MKKYIYVPLTLLALFMINSCGNTKPPHHPKHPNYAIEKPPVKFKANKANLQKMVKKLQGKPYVWAEEGPNQFDCSGLTYYMYGSMGIEIPRVARDQAKKGKRIAVKDLKYGDLIFFATNRRNSRKITHVGMYLGDGWFTHASTVKHEVVYSNLFTSAYYKKKLRICRRYLPEKVALTTNKPFWVQDGSAEDDTFQAAMIPSSTPTPKTSSLPIVNEKGDFFIQVGSFVGKPNKRLQNKIKSFGYKQKNIQFNVGVQRISRLLIGPYKTKDDAYDALQGVRNNIERSAFIAEIR